MSATTSATTTTMAAKRVCWAIGTFTKPNFTLEVGEGMMHKFLQVLKPADHQAMLPTKRQAQNEREQDFGFIVSTS